MIHTWQQTLCRTGQIVRRLWHNSWQEHGLLAEAACWVVLTRMALALLPFEIVARRLGNLHHESAPDAAPADAAAALHIGWAVQAITRHSRWSNRCLVQAIAAQIMLRRRRLAGTLYLGVATDGADAFRAHAWVRCGAHIITGAQGQQRFTPIASFGTG